MIGPQWQRPTSQWGQLVSDTHTKMPFGPFCLRLVCPSCNFRANQPYHFFFAFCCYFLLLPMMTLWVALHGFALSGRKQRHLLIVLYMPMLMMDSNGPTTTITTTKAKGGAAKNAEKCNAANKLKFGGKHLCHSQQQANN